MKKMKKMKKINKKNNKKNKKKNQKKANFSNTLRINQKVLAIFFFNYYFNFNQPSDLAKKIM